MAKEIFINVTPYEKRVAVVSGKLMEEFYIERSDSVNLVGNIYKGRVEAVLPGMGAAFVEMGLEKNGFLYVDDVVTGISSYESFAGEADEEYMEKAQKTKGSVSIEKALKKGDEVVVQVVKEPISTKGARLTTHISIPGRFLVLMPFDNHIGISKRIEDKAERDRIRKILEGMKLPKDIGFVVRTAAVGVGERDFFREAHSLMGLWRHIKEKARRAKPSQLIHKEYGVVLRVVRDIFTSDFSKLEIDSRDEFKSIMRFLRIYAPHLRSRVRLYRGNVPIFEKFDVERLIEKIYSRIVNLKSGGYLIFDETESLVAIDVNSGKFVGKRNLEDTAFKTNMEAAQEVPRQLKLRDIGGIIIIDFIDMEFPQHRKTVFKTLERALEDDKAKTNILNISSIGLVEMTRQRARKSIEGKSYQKCPYCSGRGTVKSIATMGIEVLRKVEKTLAQTKAREVFVSLNPEVAAYLSKPERAMFESLEKRFRKTIRVIEDPNMHLEDVKVDEGRA